MLNDRRFCVYTYTTSDNVVFYVGSGTLERARNSNGRTEDFIEKKKLGFYFTVLHSNLTKDESLDIENEYLSEYFTSGIPHWQLVNKKKSAAKVKALTYAFCSAHWYYCEDSPSKLCWKHDRFGHNNRIVVKAGTSAGSINSSGYYNTNINKQFFGVHRIVWVLLNRKDLSTGLVINHIDSCRTNNSQDNLEAVTPRINNIKRKVKSEDMRNIYWHKRDKLWDVRWRDNGTSKSARFKPKDYGSIDESLIAAKEFRDNLRNIFYSFSQSGLN